LKVRYGPKASAQIEEASNYIARDNPRAADAFRARIEVVVSHLARFPFMGREADEANVRSVLLTPFRYRLFMPSGREPTRSCFSAFAIRRAAIDEHRRARNSA
jgi:plasmid stabilization system protein ParE